MAQTYYGWRARWYNWLWRTFSIRTQSAAMRMVDFDAVRAISLSSHQVARILDVACGTGTLLHQLVERLPDSEAYGVDASADMIAQAKKLLGGRGNITLSVGVLGAGPTARLPYALRTFDLITFTNALHYLPDPVATLTDLG